MGTTPETIELFAKLQRYAPTLMSMVIQGETGKQRVTVRAALRAIGLYDDDTESTRNGT